MREKKEALDDQGEGEKQTLHSCVPASDRFFSLHQSFLSYGFLGPFFLLYQKVRRDARVEGRKSKTIRRVGKSSVDQE